MFFFSRRIKYKSYSKLPPKFLTTRPVPIGGCHFFIRIIFLSKKNDLQPVSVPGLATRLSPPMYPVTAIFKGLLKYYLFPNKETIIFA